MQAQACRVQLRTSQWKRRRGIVVAVLAPAPAVLAIDVEAASGASASGLERKANRMPDSRLASSTPRAALLQTQAHKPVRSQSTLALPTCFERQCRVLSTSYAFAERPRSEHVDHTIAFVCSVGKSAADVANFLDGA